MNRPIVWLFLFVFISFSCGYNKSNRQLFEERLDANVEACMDPFIQKGLDSLAAESVCRCLLTKAYEVDSTFFLKPLTEAEAFWNEHSEEFTECIKWLKEYNGYTELLPKVWINKTD